MKRILLAALLLAGANAFAWDVGNIVNSAVNRAAQGHESSKDIPEDQEVALGEQAMASFLGASPLHSDANMQRYVNRVGKWVALHSGRPDLPWTFAVIDTETINAFALPGGYILISSGLLKRLSSESELAGVLAHEVAHVVKKHQIQAIQSAGTGDALAGFGKDVVGGEIARRGGNVVAQTAKTWATGVVADAIKNGLFLRPLDRSMEYDADQLGVVIATRAGYDPYGLVGALEMLAQYKGGGDAASVFATHPPATDRLSQLEKFWPKVERYSGQPQLENRFRQTVTASK
jgi:predicted Zn-dependent protease